MFENSLDDELTKPPKGGSVSSVSGSDKESEKLTWLTRLKLHNKKSQKALCEGLTKPTEVELRENIREAVEERAAILEFEANIPRKDAEKQARLAIKVYEYRLNTSPETWLKMVAPGCNLEDARQFCFNTFGNELLEIRVCS
ncbi:MAG: hypothetical protein OEZ68_02370 [Gammaproteobacteria bacterium]|nr:hypothetical protein [Gammaproteobacteria bacterium]MDH5799627.1 hypothetical protein [Gammaproteobacteria bacterium]